MSTFDETVARLTAQGRAAPNLGSVVKGLHKEASQTSFSWGKEGIADKAKKLFNAPEIASHMAKTLGTAAITGSVAGLLYKAQSSLYGDPIEAEEAKKETGKLSARSNFKMRYVTALKTQHEKVFKQISKDPEIKRADPELMRSYYNTMKNFAPNLAADENAARAFLFEHAVFGKPPHYASLKNLADAERAVAESGGFMG